jgi:PAS domain S-box-containing protein
MKNSIPSSIIMVDKNNNIINWNKKTEDMLGLGPKMLKGMDLSKLSLMKKERVLEVMKQFKKNKKPVTVKSISIKNKKGDIHLTNISHLPIIDSNGETQGALMVINDVTEIAEVQAELKQRQVDLENLDRKFQDIHTKFKLVNMGRNEDKENLMKVRTEMKEGTKEMLQADVLLKEKQRELELLNKSIELKTNELNGISIKLKEGKSALRSIGAEIEEKQKELTISKESDKSPGGIWKDSTFKMYDEIDEHLPREDSSLKTKKLNDDETE